MLDPAVLIFDIETVADTESYRNIKHLDDMPSAQDLLAVMHSERLADTGSTFVRHHLQQIAAISLLLVQPEGIRLWSLGRGGENEAVIVKRFFDGIERLSPTLVSWNGSGFDLPVLHYRALKHAISAPAYFDTGDISQQSRFNNYLGRFHWRHIDMMDVLAGYQARAAAPLNDIAKLCGLPGKLETDGSQVQDLWNAGEQEKICDYCETDVLNTYGVFLRFELLRGRLTAGEYQQKLDELRQFLTPQSAPHLQEFLASWSAA